MTDKRFTIDEKMLGYLGEFVCDNGVMIKELSDVVDLLNDLHEENTALKTDRHRFEEEAKLFALFEADNNLREENTRIKTTIDEAIRTERTQIGQSVLKQLRDRIQ